MGTRKAKVNLHRVPLFISEDHLGFIFSKFGDVSSIKSKARIATGHFEIENTINSKQFMEIPQILICKGRLMPLWNGVDFFVGLVGPQGICRKLARNKIQNHNPISIMRRGSATAQTTKTLKKTGEWTEVITETRQKGSRRKKDEKKITKKINELAKVEWKKQKNKQKTSQNQASIRPGFGSQEEITSRSLPPSPLKAPLPPPSQYPSSHPVSLKG